MRSAAAHLVYFEDMQQGYVELVDYCFANGRSRSPRGMKTLELANTTVVLEDPRKSHPVGIGRRYSPAIAAAEALSLVGGVADPFLMLSVGSRFKLFMDGGQLHGAYGPRVRDQFPKVHNRLREDADTRQAVLQVWDSKYDLSDHWVPRDPPCTLSLTFALVDDRLEMGTVMRSNDLWYGTAHDFPMFTALQLTMASALGVEPGPYVHFAHSLHLYERNFDAAEQLLQSPMGKVDVWPGGGVDSAGGPHQGQMRARQILDGELPPVPTQSERYYYETLLPHVDEAQRHRDELTGEVEELS